MFSLFSHEVMKSTKCEEKNLSQDPIEKFENTDGAQVKIAEEKTGHEPLQPGTKFIHILRA
jgi:hypothetical protein